MIIPKEKKNEYWNHFLELKTYWPHGFTLKRLEKIKDIVFKDIDFWDDIILRHGAYDTKPLDLNQHTYQHLFGNFAGMLGEILHKNKIKK